MATPPLGFIRVQDRTPAQQAAHLAALGVMKQFTLPPVQLAKGEAIRLFDFWKHPDVVADVGFVFTRFHQFTGSCVGVGGGNGSFSTIAAQRVAADAPTKAFLPFWPSAYAMSRHYMGDDGQGEGSLGSTFAKALTADGLRDWPTGAGLPPYTQGEGIEIGEGTETRWSSYRNPDLQAVLLVSRQHLMGSAAECNSVQDIRAMVGNGYGVTFACNNYVGNASIKGSGDKARVMGRWDGSGGHQQSIHAYEEHPDFGPIYWAQNSWPDSTYPRAPAGGPVCGCWVAESDVQAAMRLDAEVYGLSHLNYFPAQPNVLHWVV